MLKALIFLGIYIIIINLYVGGNIDHQEILNFLGNPRPSNENPKGVPFGFSLGFVFGLGVRGPLKHAWARGDGRDPPFVFVSVRDLRMSWKIHKQKRTNTQKTH